MVAIALAGVHIAALWTVFHPHVSPAYQAFYIDGTQSDWITNHYVATPEQGMEFKRWGLPNWVAATFGLAVHEGWGRWTDGDVARTPAIVFAQPLTGPRCVEFEAGAAPWLKGKNFSVRMDGESQTLRFAGPEPHTYRAGFSLTQPAERLEFLMPGNLPRLSEMEKRSLDNRRVGLGLVRLRILPGTCSTSVEELGKN